MATLAIAGNLGGLNVLGTIGARRRWRSLSRVSRQALKDSDFGKD